MYAIGGGMSMTCYLQLISPLIKVEEGEFPDHDHLYCRLFWVGAKLTFGVCLFVYKGAYTDIY